MGAFGDPDRVFEEYYASASNRRGDVAGAYVLTAAGISFLVYSSAEQASIRGGNVITARLSTASAVVFAALLVIAAAALSAVSFSIAFGESFGDERPFSSAYAIVPQLGAVLLVAVAPLVASLHMVATVLAGRGHFSTVVTVTSLVCAIALLFSVLYIPLLALPVWVLVTAFRSR
jgi:hypothetical protein